MQQIDAAQGEPEFLDVWNEAYASVMSHSRAKDGYSVCNLSSFSLALTLVVQYRVVSMLKGQVASSNVDSLSAFWAGLQVLAGDIQGAVKSHLYCEFASCGNPVRPTAYWRRRLEFMEKVSRDTRAF
jgi:hypothetical protein